MPAIKGPLDAGATKVVGDALQGALVDLIDLSLAAKQAHWNLIGERFRPIHLQLDEVVTTAREHTDTVAERAATMGVNPDGRANTVANDSSAPKLPEGWLKDTAVVDHFVERLAQVIGRMRERIDATDAPDQVTQDVLIAVTADLEKHYWMFQAEH